MDLYGGASKWTNCSNEDFLGLLNNSVSCLPISKTNLSNNISIRETDTQKDQNIDTENWHTL